MSDVSNTNDLIAESRWHVPYAGSPDDNWCIHCADEWPCVTRRLADALEAATRVPVQGEPNDDRGTLMEAMKRGEKVRQAAWSAYGQEPDGEGTKPHSDNWYRAEALMAAGFSRTAVPDAATEELEALKDIAETHALCADRLSIEKERADRVAREVCDRGCSYTGGPDEECSAHGRTPRELWEFIAQDVVGRDAATERAEKAEAERDAAVAAIERVRGVLSEWESRQERNREILGSGALGHFQAIDCTGDLVAALDGAPELDPYDDFCPTCDAPNPGHTETCEVPFRYPDSALDGAPEPEVAEAETGVRPWADRFRYAGSDAGNGVLARGFERAKAERERQARLDVLRGQSTDEIVNGLQLPVEGESDE